MFTVGAKHAFSRYFRKTGYPQKPKGSPVWKTYEEAKAHAEKAYSFSRIIYGVYGLKGDWETDTEDGPKGQRVLKRMMDMVRL